MALSVSEQGTKSLIVGDGGGVELLGEGGILSGHL